MKRIVIAAVAAFFLLAGSVAQAQTTFVTFTTIDAVEAQYAKIVITGVKSGETVPTTFEILCSASSSDGKCAGLLQNCERLAVLAMTKPGQYLFKAGPVYTSAYNCKLERVAP